MLQYCKPGKEVRAHISLQLSSETHNSKILPAEIPESRRSSAALKRLVSRAIKGLLVGVLQGEGSGGAILPRLGAEVVVEAGAGGHGLGVEVGREGAILFQKVT